MPNPVFEPIIGRDFSDIGAQRYAWAGFNANIEAQNLARAAAAEEAQNRWALTNAQMAREDAARQAAIDANARNVALNLALSREQMAAARRSELEQAARQESQFGESMKFAREDLAARGEQAKEKLDLLEAQQKARVDFNGERFAAQYGLLKRAAEQASEAADTAVSSFERAQADQTRITALPKKTEEDLSRLQEIGRTFADLQREARLKSKLAEHATADFNALKAKMDGQGYEWSDSTGKISHPLGSREWSFTKAVSDAAGGGKKTPISAPVAAASASSSPNWFSRNIIKPVLAFGNSVGQQFVPSSLRPAALVQPQETMEPAETLLPPPTAGEIQAFRANRYAVPTIEKPKRATGRIYRDANGNVVVERY